MLKFRAWHKELKVMIDSQWIAHVFFANGIYQSIKSTKIYNHKMSLYKEEIELMQSTCIKSKDNVEIFESDILCHDHGGGVETFVIERNPDDNQLQARWLYMPGDNTDYLGEAPLASSVIVGNVFQNPELLEVNDE